MYDLESIQINLNSKFAIKKENTGNSYCIFDLPRIEIPSQHHIHISVKNAIIPYSWFNINDSNNCFVFYLNDVDNSFTMDIGNYNVFQMVSHINSLIFSTGIICKYNSLTNKLIFSHPNKPFIFQNISTALGIFGFYSGINKSCDDNFKIVSDNCINMQSVQVIHIQTNFLTMNINTNDIFQQNTLCTIPINQIPFSNIIYENDTNFRTNLYTNELTEMTIKLVDQNGDFLDFNGLDWSITLELEITDFVN
jgi:hypothetical protein